MTLTEFSYQFKKALPFVLIFFIILLILFYILKLLFLYLGMQKPSIVFNPVFGRIEAPRVKDKLAKTDFKYRLDNIAGEPVTATRSAKVFFLPEEKTSFGYLEKAYLLAKNLGFDTDTVNYKFDKQTKMVFETKTRKLAIEITNFNFSYQYKYQRNPQIFLQTTIPEEDFIKSRATEVITNLGRYPEELAKGKNNVIYLYFDPLKETIEAVKDRNEANLVEVDFYRADIDGFPIVPPKYFTSQNFVVMVFKGNSYSIVKAQIKFFKTSIAKVGLYPIKSGQQAWDELTSNKATIVAAPLNEQEIVIKKMFMGYLDPDFYQPYLEPVYVFLGANNFVAYVPAIANDYLQN